VATLHDGEIIGEMSLLTRAPRTATVAALRPTVTLEIGKPAVVPLLAKSPELAERFADWLRRDFTASEITERIRRFFARPA